MRKSLEAKLDPRAALLAVTPIYSRKSLPYTASGIESLDRLSAEGSLPPGSK